jgi:aminoglycoside phosphotransferase (APT) family kinase protein
MSTELSGAGAVRQNYEFDAEKLAGWMVQHVDGFAGPIVVEQFKGGQSNPTYKLNTPRRAYVLRRKPPGQLLKGAHAVDREARVIAALEKVGFPVPHVYALCIDATVIGSWFYVMEWIEGRIFWDAALPGVTDDNRGHYFDAMNQVIAKLHNVDYRAIGLVDYGRAGNYFERQIARWSDQYRSDAPSAGRSACMDMLIDWLPAHIPPDTASSLIHGDFRIDNLIFHPTEARIIAVLDWELSTIGHPLADFAYHLMMYRLASRVISGLQGAPLSKLGIPSESDYVTAYCRRTNRGAIGDLDFYLAFNMFRMAAIFHGIKGRLIRGTATSERAKDYAGEFEWMAETGWQQVVASRLR